MTRFIDEFFEAEIRNLAPLHGFTVFREGLRHDRSGVTVAPDLVPRPDPIIFADGIPGFAGADFSIGWDVVGTQGESWFRVVQVFVDAIFVRSSRSGPVDVTLRATLDAAVSYWYGGQPTLRFARNTVGDLSILGMLTGAWEGEEISDRLEVYAPARNAIRALAADAQSRRFPD